MILEGKIKSLNINRLSALKEKQIEKCENFDYYNKSIYYQSFIENENIKKFYIDKTFI